MNSMKITGMALATAAAGLFSAVSVGTASAADAKVHCENSTACKGQGACATATHGCSGMNACKGQGWTEQKSAEACKAAQDAAKK